MFFKNREFRIRSVKIDDINETPAQEAPLTFIPRDIKEIMFTGAICIGGIIAAVSVANVIETIAIHHGTKN